MNVFPGAFDCNPCGEGPARGGCGFLGGTGGFSCIINLVIILIVMQFLCGLINNNSCC